MNIIYRAVKCGGCCNASLITFLNPGTYSCSSCSIILDYLFIIITYYCCCCFVLHM